MTRRFGLIILGFLMAYSCCLSGQTVINVKGLSYKSVIRSMVVDSSGKLWVGSYGVGTWRVEGDKILPVHGKGGKMPSRRVSKLFVDGPKVWSATAGDGVWCYDSATDEWSPIQPDPGERGKFLHAFYKMPDGDIFLGSVGSGVARLHNGAWQFYKEEDGLHDTWLNDCVVVPEGLWFGGSYGLFLFQKDKFTNWVTPQNVGFSEKYWCNPETNSMVASGSILYIGTVSDGIFRITPDGLEKKVKGAQGNVQSLVFWKNHLWGNGPGAFWKIDHAAKDLIATSVVGPWEPECHFKCLAVSPDNQLLAGTFDGRVYKSPDGASFSLYISFKDGALVLNK